MNFGVSNLTESRHNVLHSYVVCCNCLDSNRYQAIRLLGAFYCDSCGRKSQVFYLSDFRSSLCLLFISYFYLHVGVWPFQMKIQINLNFIQFFYLFFLNRLSNEHFLRSYQLTTYIIKTFFYQLFRIVYNLVVMCSVK